MRHAGEHRDRHRPQAAFDVFTKAILRTCSWRMTFMATSEASASDLRPDVPMMHLLTRVGDRPRDRKTGTATHQRKPAGTEDVHRRSGTCGDFS